jgi:hypothetical protein
MLRADDNVRCVAVAARGLAVHMPLAGRRRHDGAASEGCAADAERGRGAPSPWREWILRYNWLRDPLEDARVHERRGGCVASDGATRGCFARESRLVRAVAAITAPLEAVAQHVVHMEIDDSLARAIAGAAVRAALLPVVVRTSSLRVSLLLQRKLQMLWRTCRCTPSFSTRVSRSPSRLSLSTSAPSSAPCRGRGQVTNAALLTLALQSTASIIAWIAVAYLIL